MKFLLILLTVLVLFTLCNTTTYTGSVYFSTDSSTYTYKQGMDTDAVSYAKFDDTLFEIGFGRLHLYTNKDYGDYIQMYAAGFLEGHLTQERIWNQFSNFKVGTLQDYNTTTWPKKLAAWMQKNIDYTRQQCETPSDDLRTQFCYNLKQFDGLLDGYNQASSTDQQVTEMDLWLFQSQGDLDDLGVAVFLDSEDQKEREEAISKVHSSEWHDNHHHCTGLVKVLPDHSDIFFSQVTWSAYFTLSRIFKQYTLNLNEGSNKASTIVFSSYPGMLFSVDDFYITDQQLCVLETTFNIFNESLYIKYVTHNTDTFLTWIRVQAINRLAVSGETWVDNMKVVNSGTYNNQWIVLDMKEFTPGRKLKEGLLWELEMIPGFTYSQDRTVQWLNTKTYYPSINTPENRTLFDLAGFPAKVKEDGDYWSYWYNARMKIMERDVYEKIQNYDDFKSFMRYNNYLNDPLSNDDPAQSIASRYDLRTTNTTKKKFKKAPFGALDAKTTNYQFAQDMKFSLISSPTYVNNLPIWEFGVPPLDSCPWQGLPKSWKFDWDEFQSEQPN
ncbi:phospholipase b-related [Anaeramoeba flamelloides]|uniref:Phospholipase B-like n=1 Tax=Anaeramoeba flamelloides TaxID=1746091 RepID=A0ABQ8XCJ0_9EUKA|nr:phospholipase b-related [Anaeramoeba flamelloides]